MSPGRTCQATISTSATPSPMSGVLKTNSAIGSALHHLAERRGDAGGSGEIFPLEDVRVGGVPAGDPRDRRLEVVETVLLHEGGQLGAEAAGPRRLVDDHAAA